METIPCKDCISICICKAQAANTDYKSPTSLIQLFGKLSYRCSSITEYLQITYDNRGQIDLLFTFYDMNLKRLNEVCIYLTDNEHIEVAI
jgi:hypothetical protein